jgi:hypothetical protein
VVKLLKSAAQLEKSLRKLKFPFCFIGGVAVQRWAEPRATRDLDLSLLCGFGREEAALDELLKLLRPRIPDARAFALQNRVALLCMKNGVEVDIALAGLPFEEELQRRASRFTFARGVQLTTCSAEDLIVLKAFADRARDWGDVESVCQRQSRLDWKYIGGAGDSCSPRACSRPVPTLRRTAWSARLQGERLRFGRRRQQPRAREHQSQGSKCASQAPSRPE